MEEKSGDVPLPPAAAVVGIIYNCKRNSGGPTPDAEAEYDSIDTVHAIRDAITSAGFKTILLEGDETLPRRLAETPIDIAFNIAEGLRGRGREAEIPALLNLLGIPFTGSDETALCIALDKALCKRLLTACRVRTPRFLVLSDKKHIVAGRLRFPVIVKPNAEGSSKGIPDACIAANEAEYRELVARELELYGQPVLAEEYIAGREFTVGILGNGGETRIFPPMEIVFRGNTHRDYRVYSFDVKQDYKTYVDYRCPAELSSTVEKEIIRMARRVYDVLGCRDFARVDFRLGEDGKPYFIEINPLPGLAPGYSDYPMLAAFCGVSYQELVLSVLRAGMTRCGLAAVK